MIAVRRIFVLTVALLTPAVVHAASWTTSWGNLFHPQPAGVVVLRDGSAVAAATMGSQGLLVRVAPDGSLRWSRRLDRVNSIQFIARTAGDDIFLGGFDAGVKKDDPVIAWIARLDADGNIVWVRRLKGSGNLLLRAGAGTRDGGVIVCGGTHQQSWIVKLTSDGAIEWQHFFDAPQKDFLAAVMQTRDGGYLAAGHAVNTILVKLSARGDVVWRRGYGDGGEIAAVAEREDGGIVVAGTIDDSTFLARLSPRGDPVWQQVTPAIRRDEAYDALLLPSGNLLVIAVTNSYVENGNGIMLIELTPDGKIVRQSVAENEIPRSPTVAHYGAAARDGAVYLLTASRDTMRLRRMENGVPAPNDCWSTSNATMKSLGEPPPPVDWPVVDEKVTIAMHSMQSTAFAITAGQTCTAVTAGREAAPARDEVAIAITEYEKEIQRLLVAKEFARLDAIETELVRDMPLFRTLNPKLWVFYSAVASQKLTARIGQEQHLALLREWIAKSPSSAGARIALPETLINMAWAARGSGYADTISEHGGEVFSSFMAQALKALQESSAVASRDPEYFQLSMIVQTLSPVEAIRAASRFPFDATLYWTAVDRCMPKWGGTPDELHAVLDAAAKHGGPRYGSALAGVAGWELIMSDTTPDDVVKVWSLPWERIRAGFRAWASTPPGDSRAPHWFAQCAYKMRDRSTARELFDSPDLDWSEVAAQAWDSRQAYDTARKWALPAPVESFTEEGAVSRPAESTAAAPKFEKPGAAWPQIVLRSELNLTSGEKYDVNAFLVKTADGGVIAVSAASPLRPNFDPFRSTVMPATANDQLRARLKTWTLHAPGAAKTFSVRGVAPRRTSVLEAGVVLDVGNPPEPPAHALLPRMNELKVYDKVYLLGCPPGDTDCRQNVYAGTVLMHGPGYAIVSFADPMDLAAFFGCPIVDEDGRAAAVVSGSRPDQGPMKGGALVEEMAALLSTAGSGAPVPRP
jgi:outer membrane protein assembly factor BamB